jgi:peptide-methionine (S)-S-oxide reductase
MANRRGIAIMAFTVLVFATPAFAAGQKAVFAGGCFWGVEAVFEHVKGVTDVRSGYAGGTSTNANYEAVSGGGTDHAETVEITFDPTSVSFEQLLMIFFSVAHDPTEVDRQGPDSGRQYRSVIFYVNEQQKKTAESFIAAVNSAKAFERPVATQVEPLRQFFAAEEYHQDYVRKNPADSYVVAHDLPKLKELQRKFQSLYRRRSATSQRPARSR